MVTKRNIGFVSPNFLVGIDSKLADGRDLSVPVRTAPVHTGPNDTTCAGQGRGGARSMVGPPTDQPVRKSLPYNTRALCAAQIGKIKMSESVFMQGEFFALIIFSIIVPFGIYIYMMWKKAITRTVVLLLGSHLLCLTI